MTRPLQPRHATGLIRAAVGVRALSGPRTAPKLPVTHGGLRADAVEVIVVLVVLIASAFAVRRQLIVLVRTLPLALGLRSSGVVARHAPLRRRIGPAAVTAASPRAAVLRRRVPGVRRRAGVAHHHVPVQRRLLRRRSNGLLPEG